MNPIRLRYQRALDGLQHVITSFPDRCWDRRSPCTAWTARMLAGHVIDGQRQVASMLTGQPRPPVTDPTELGRVAGSDPATAWREARRAIDDALAATPDDATIPTPAGHQPVDRLLTTAIVEPVLHSWDLAVTAGVDVDLDDEAVDAVLHELAHVDTELAATGMYAPAVAVGDDMSARDRLLRLTGRDPAATGART